MRPRGLLFGGWVVTAAAFIALIPFVFVHVPSAQAQAGGLAQKIFYFHVPAAWAFYACGLLCCVSSALYLLRPSPARDAWARAGAECACVFGALVLASGPLWGKKAWGSYWTWDPRLTTLLLGLMIYLAIVVLRRFADGGESERRLAAGVGVLGGANLPIIHFAVEKWGGIHPARPALPPVMQQGLYGGAVAMLLLATLLLTLRAQLAASRARLAHVEELLPDTNG